MAAYPPLIWKNGRYRQLTVGDSLALAAPFSIVQVASTAAGQTIFMIPGGYTVGYILPHFKGVFLEDADFTANDGTTVVLSVAADEIGDILRVVVFGTLQVANTTPLVCTVATLPSASANIYQTRMVTDLTGGMEEVFSTGTQWLRKSDRSVAN